MPFHFASWGSNASIVISPQRFLETDMNLLRKLDAIPYDDVVRMRTSIEQNAHRLVYGLVPFRNDAVETTLRGVYERVVIR